MILESHRVVSSHFHCPASFMIDHGMSLQEVKGGSREVSSTVGIMLVFCEHINNEYL